MIDWTPWPPEFAERYRARGHWTGETFGALLTRAATHHADRVAVVDQHSRWTYRELDDRATRTAHGLAARGVRPGDRVIVQLPNVAEYLSVLFGLFRLGALPVLALPAHRRREITAFARAAGATAYVTADRHNGCDHRRLARDVAAELDTPLSVFIHGEPEEFTPLREVPTDPGPPLTDPDPARPAFLQLSGGSTGVPKLIPRTPDDYLYSVRESARICRLTEHDVYLVALPVAHNFPMSSPGVLGVLHTGGRIVLAPAPSPDIVFDLIEREGVTITAAVPPLALAWLNARDRAERDLSGVRLLQVGGAKLVPEAARRLRDGLGVPIQQVFGMAEGLVNYTRDDDPEEIVLTTQGRPISPDDEILVLDDADRPVPPGEVGHLLTRGPYTIRGYHRAEAVNARSFTTDGFYRTGDLVRLTPTGHLVVEGRAGDLINRGGEKVAAEEIEDHLLAHPGIRDVAVVGIPDDHLGERTCAFVIAADGLTAAGVRGFLRTRGLAAYKTPDRVEFIDRFPHTGVGKTSRRELRAALAALFRKDP